MILNNDQVDKLVVVVKSFACCKRAHLLLANANGSNKCRPASHLQSKVGSGADGMINRSAGIVRIRAVDVIEK